MITVAPSGESEMWRAPLPTSTRPITRAAAHVDGDDLAGHVVTDVGEAAARVSRGVARAGEPLEHPAHPRHDRVEHGDGARLVAHDKRASQLVDGLDAVGLVRHLERAVDSHIGEPHREDAVLGVGGHERERHATARCGALRGRPAQGDGRRGCSDQELSAIHAGITAPARG